MAAAHSLLARIGMAHPIIQAPMAGVSTPQLAAAVSNAGGLGSIGIGADSVERARQAIEQTRALTDGPFNVNVFCHRPAVRDTSREAAWLQYLAPLYDELGVARPAGLHEIYRSFRDDPACVQMLVEQRPAVVSFHFGLPAASAITALREAGIILLASATCDHEADRIELAGVDAVIAQGVEAGGHRGVFDPEAADEGLGTMALVRRLVTRTRLPVIAAGGIMDGQGIRAALGLGAVAAQLGTAFILCPESAANAGYRQLLGSARANRTRMTRVISGRPARGIVNRLVEFGEADGSPDPADYPVAYDAAKQLHAAASAQGSLEFAAHWAGQGAPLARSLPAAQLFATLVREMAS
ncbi:nitronate monooxygenase [Stenotrophomonas sp. 24(2023)]|uniref:NAD(P)H-dependent flavin oxidoreductase n=1 Tax=Stenotrophomonas sp. 24(2023) TaxID=3068324 RepID=UPI0027DFD5F4|nr:nitronate monooxygenase [Stenotrophomonas sp. 24(2023)]WMJ68722.1 nitronate monooxygenase [Stenotrophomonas sp. 24(2023)]